MQLPNRVYGWGDCVCVCEQRRKVSVELEGCCFVTSPPPSTRAVTRPADIFRRLNRETFGRRPVLSLLTGTGQTLMLGPTDAGREGT